ncbi:short-chain dehydrogenase [Sphingobacterium cellulitidis]|uniref:pirin family protein n=1 Tax=Sphingobacterium cellulitidis TaxID=1768011 RepID=UPI000B93FA55|nr:pirin family protein [Sphingobacterium cellulitidis]OYD47560.1 short-chain dehydrogenase [Sphingobacterium cellulitidis]
MKEKQIEKIIKPGMPHFVGDGFRVHSFIPSAIPMQRMDPFIVFDYNSKYNFPASSIPKGVGVHPHRGFETVTLAYKGRVEHADSSGGGGIIGEGDVQWMTAASGVLHKEFHESEWSKEGGEFQMVQLWVNLPAAHKMSDPKYQALENKSIPKVQLADGLGYVEVVAGEYQGTKGAASTFTPVNLFNAKLKTDGKAEFEFPESYNTGLLILEGSVKVNGEEVATDHFVLFENNGEKISVEAMKDALILVLSAEPINEPIAAYGPFVMNTEAEIKQAFRDFQTGKFGFLED